MKLIQTMIIVGLFVLSSPGIPAMTPEPGARERYIIQFVPGGGRGMIEAFGGEVIYLSPQRGFAVAWLSPNAVEALGHDSRIRSIQPDVRVRLAGQTMPWGIGRIGADTVHAGNATLGQGINVAVLDTGIDYNHPDLGANYRGGYDWVNDDEDPMDDHGHGTHCAGTIAALDNDIGVMGVAPRARLYGLKVLDSSGDGWFSHVIAAIEWSIDNGMDIVSMSLSGPDHVGALEDICDEAYQEGILLVAAAGNDGRADGQGDNVGYPARYDSVIAVASTDSDDRRASDSSTGPAVEMAAPGVSVLSTHLDGEYVRMSGTSMACPHVAGTAALMLSSDPALTNVQVRELLVTTSIDLGQEGRDTWFGHGLVDAREAVSLSDVTPPTAHAGPDQTVEPATLVIFDAGGSTDNIGIVNYTWTFQDGTGTGTITLYGSGPFHTFTLPGVYEVILNVTDAAGNWHIDTVNVTVNDTQPPTADAGPDRWVDEGDRITLDGSGSTDNLGIVNYTWTFQDGTGTGTITLYGSGPFHTFTLPGVYMVTLNVTDDAGNWHIDTVNVTVNDTRPPTAYAGPDRWVDEGDPVTFDGSACTDNVAIVNYTWTFQDGTGTGTGTITLYGIAPVHTFPIPGVFMVTLNVTDAAGHRDTDTMNVTVNDTTPPMARAGPDRWVGEGSLVTFNGSASTDNVGIVNYTWTFFDGAEDMILYGIAPGHTFPIPGIFTATLNITDAAGNRDTGTMTITVNDTTPPTARAGPDRQVNQRAWMTFDGGGSTDNVGIMAFTWTFFDGTGDMILHGMAPGHTFTLPGAYRVTLNVTDAAGNWHSDTMNVTVSGDVTPPSAHAGPDRMVDEGMEVTLDGRASTDNVGIKGYTWTFIDGAGGNSTGFEGNVNITLSGVSPTHRFNVPGVYIITLEVTDAAGNRDTDIVNITVNDITPPTARAGPDQHVPAGSVVTFDGGGSTDNVGIAGYTWSFRLYGITMVLTGVSPTYGFPAAGTYPVTLTVQDLSGNTDTDTMEVVVSRPENPGSNGGEGQETLSLPWDVILPPLLPVILVILAIVVAGIIFLARGRRTRGTLPPPAEDDTPPPAPLRAMSGSPWAPPPDGNVRDPAFGHQPPGVSRTAWTPPLGRAEMYGEPAPQPPSIPSSAWAPPLGHTEMYGEPAPQPPSIPSSAWAPPLGEPTTPFPRTPAHSVQTPGSRSYAAGGTDGMYCAMCGSWIHGSFIYCTECGHRKG